ncbi:MAG: DUF4878 domain-containing protein, partial [Neisseria sp.]|nr:DUF4878 domain-containing protein [Neisseria sp.]
MNKLFTPLAAIALSAVLAACSGAGSSPEGTAKAFIEKTYQGDADGAMALIDIPAEAKDKPGVEEMVNGKIKAGVAQSKARADQLGGVDEVTAQPFQASPQDAKQGRVQVDVRFKQGNTKTENVSVIETDHGWKIKL